MRIFGLIILNAKKYDAAQLSDKKALELIVKLEAEKQQLITHCQQLIQCNKSRQMGRALARRQNKIENGRL